MAAATIDEYLAGLGETQRATLEVLRATLHDLLPDAQECISYAIPGFRVEGHVVAGFAAFKNHLSYFPHSGSIIPQMRRELRGFHTTNATLRFANDAPLPRDLVARLVELRLAQLRAQRT
ncbi:MAG: iron chaperone [Acidimicrobiales bacterium]